MAKEMMIVFVYDPLRCRKEEDDPAEAVLYFHPSWVSPTQRLALAGQLMGVHQFLSTSFSAPSLITLQGGKFVLKRFNQYILAVGTDRNIQDWILKRRGDFLESILRLFHCDLDTISQSLNNDRNKFTEKLYQMLETYLPILQYSANLFSSMPMIKLPKTASSVFLESLQLLQCCQETPGIIGGAMFFNNKVVATQLSPDLTKQLVITDPYRIKAPAERVSTDFHLPLGVQLLRVYIPRKKNSDDLRTSDNQRKLTKKSSLTNCGMKRDTSRIFTVPEEGEDPPDPPDVPEVLPGPRRPPKQEFRPKRPHPTTPSVCSTPLKDVNRILHDTAVLICNTTDETVEAPMGGEVSGDIDDIPDVVKEALRCKRMNKIRLGGVESQEKKLKKQQLTRRTCSLSSVSTKAQETPDVEHRPLFNTITDPSYPVFKFDGSPVSQNLYDYYVSRHFQELKDPSILSKNQSATDPFKDFDSTVPKDPQNFSNFPEKSPLDVRLGKKRPETCRRSMSLPLKSLNAPEGPDDRRKSSSECNFEVPLKKKLEGLQLTPLMSKLSLLANDDRTSGFCSKETTPSEYYDLPSRLSRNTQEDDELWPADREPGVLEKAELFICGHQSMVMVLLMEHGVGNNPELIHDLWETCMSHLGRLESRLQRCMEPMPSGDHKELYSVLSVDDEWDTLQRAGLWGVRELEIAGKIHERFAGSKFLTDIIVRTEDTVVYGNQCGRVQVFYQQGAGAGSSGGLPTPADLMGVVPLKAKRRLERDHGIVIL